MIQVTITYECPRCGSVDMIKNGHDYKGSQKYHCKACGSDGTLHGQQGYSRQRHEQVERALLERVSLRGIARLFDMSRKTVARWLHALLERLPPISASLEPATWGDGLELDELWSFVKHKANQQWVWLALCRRTRQVVAYWVGDRTEHAARHLWRRLPRGYATCHSFSDQYQAYLHVLDHQRHHMVAKTKGETSHVERWFNILRQPLARFTRQTLAFSKTQACHEGLLHLFILDYNLSCIS